MNKFLKHIVLGSLVFVAAACGDDDKNTWEEYADWREINEQWLSEQEALRGPDGLAVYTRVVPDWNSNAYVLMRWFNDREATKDNLSPFYTSTVDVKYIGRIYDDQAFDSSYTSVTPGDSLFRTKVSGVIPGWAIALEKMRVGDSVEVLIPYASAYGSSSQGKLIKPYSALKFNIKLVNVAGEYIRP